jgi:hypothetical protein
VRHGRCLRSSTVATCTNNRLSSTKVHKPITTICEHDPSIQSLTFSQFESFIHANIASIAPTEVRGRVHVDSSEVSANTFSRGFTNATRRYFSLIQRGTNFTILQGRSLFELKVRASCVFASFAADSARPSHLFRRTDPTPTSPNSTARLIPNVSITWEDFFAHTSFILPPCKVVDAFLHPQSENSTITPTV